MATTRTGQALLSVRDLRLEFRTSRGTASVLNGVSFDVEPGETLCIVGESGCGKSMTSLAVMGLVPMPPGRITGGSVLLDGEELLGAPQSRLREIRGDRISMIFQEPMTSLNPLFTVGQQIGESLVLHRGLRGAPARARCIELLKLVGIPAPESRVDEYPHQLSGGMRQRVMIAMALACEPAVLIADEPTTALDVTVQAQIFDLLRDLQARQHTAIVLITHDMGAVAEMADRVLVMYGGRVVEQGSTREVLDAPSHPYTQGLIACLPRLEPHDDVPAPLPEIPGVVPSIWELGAGCPFHSRCPQVMARCREEVPPMTRLGPSGHAAACWLRSEASAGAGAMA